MLFFVGLHHPGDAAHFDRACISINSLKRRRKPIACPSVLVDSGAFTEISTHGHYRTGVAEYAAQLSRLNNIIAIEAAVAQDWMCEAFILQKTGLTIADHQRLTIERYDALIAEDLLCPLLPVLQGFAPLDYARHVDAYGDRLALSAWVGVGSICKRNARPDSVVAVLDAIRRERPDLRLHGFGVKLTALQHPGVRAMLWSADSMAWSYAARRQGRDRNSWHEASAFSTKVEMAAAQDPTAWQLTLAL